MYSGKNINTIIKFILNIFIKNRIIKTDINSKMKIINEKPYIINSFKYFYYYIKI